MIYADPGSEILISHCCALFFGATLFFTKTRQPVTSKSRPNHDNEALKATAADYTTKAISEGVTLR